MEAYIEYMKSASRVLSSVESNISASIQENIEDNIPKVKKNVVLENICSPVYDTVARFTGDSISNAIKMELL